MPGFTLTPRLLTAVLLLSKCVLSVPFTAAGFPGKVITKREDLLSSYDYVIVGGGASGMVVSSRLSENPKVTVLVIEAGKFADDSERFFVPGNLFFAGVAPENMWPLMGAPMPELQNRTSFPNSARIVGGGTAINGMLFDRGAPGDYDIWGELIGDTKSWSWKGLLPYFKKSETFTPPSAEMQSKFGITFDMSVHGTKGPIQNSYPPWIYDHHRDLIKASKEVGIPVPKDGNGNAIGAFWVPNSIDPIRRERSYARNYYKLASSRPNYHIITGHLVTKLTSDSRGAITGVEFVEYADPTQTTMPAGIVKTQIVAKKEVIMAAGAAHTPKLLQLSGIGPKKSLSKLGIKTIVDLPGVGENFQDHPGAFTSWNVTHASKEMDPSYLYTNQTYNAEAYQEYLTNRTGPYTVSSGSALVFLTAKNLNLPSVLKQTESEKPEKYLLPDTHESVVKGYGKVKKLMVKHFLKGTMAVQETTSSGSGLGGGLAHPFSRGRISIPSTDPFALPIVDWRPFSNPADISILISAVKWQNSILANAPTNQAHNVVPVTPPADATDAELELWLRQTGVPSWAHLSGSCAMLKLEDGGCVDAKLKVYGTKGKVRVVDASIMPVVPGTHTQSTVYAVAEKAADIIKAADGRY